MLFTISYLPNLTIDTVKKKSFNLNLKEWVNSVNCGTLFQSIEISFIVNESDVRRGWELTNSFVNLQKFLILYGIMRKLQFQITRPSCFEVMQICDVKSICVVHRFY